MNVCKDLHTQPILENHLIIMKSINNKMNKS